MLFLKIQTYTFWIQIQEIVENKQQMQREILIGTLKFLKCISKLHKLTQRYLKVCEQILM